MTYQSLLEPILAAFAIKEKYTDGQVDSSFLLKMKQYCSP